MEVTGALEVEVGVRLADAERPLERDPPLAVADPLLKLEKSGVEGVVRAARDGVEAPPVALPTVLLLAMAASRMSRK